MATQTADQQSVTRPKPSHQAASPIEIGDIQIGQAVRQGDVLLQRVAELPSGATARRRRDLAVGSRASHLAADPAQTFSAAGTPDIYILADQRWALEHDEHAWFILPPGVYRSWRQIETIGFAATESVVRRIVVD